MLPQTLEQINAHNAALYRVLSPLDIGVTDGIATIETSRGTEKVDLTATRPDCAVKQLIRVASSRGYLDGQGAAQDRILCALGLSTYGPSGK
jgi:hypothetical protein